LNTDHHHHHHHPAPLKKSPIKRVPGKLGLRVTSVSLFYHKDVSKNNVRTSTVTISSITKNQEIPD
jgi:hypothetical protein